MGSGTTGIVKITDFGVSGELEDDLEHKNKVTFAGLPEKGYQLWEGTQASKGMPSSRIVCVCVCVVYVWDCVCMGVFI